MKQNKIDKQAERRWKKSNISFDNYRQYIACKPERCSLSFIDLLYISNFKGGNSTINEEEDKINFKLTFYSNELRNIDALFTNSNLGDLTEEMVKKLIKKVYDICDLTLKSRSTNIDGFSVSYLSALLCAHYPNLIPILDRRILKSLSLVSVTDIAKSGQIKSIQRFYGPLITKVSKISKKKKKTIREIDREEFSKYF